MGKQSHEETSNHPGRFATRGLRERHAHATGGICRTWRRPSITSDAGCHGQFIGTTSKREACESASANMEGRERHDQMQLCLAQARIDRGRQAVDQNIMAPQRQDFVRACVGGDDDRGSGGVR